MKSELTLKSDDLILCSDPFRPLWDLNSAQKIYSLDWPHDPRYCLYRSPNKQIFTFTAVVDKLFCMDMQVHYFLIRWWDTKISKHVKICEWSSCYWQTICWGKTTRAAHFWVFVFPQLECSCFTIYWYTPCCYLYHVSCRRLRVPRFSFLVW